MRKQNSVPLLPLLLLYLLALFYLGPPHPFAAAHPFFPFSRSRHPVNEPQEPPSHSSDNTITLEQASHSTQTKLDTSLLVEHTGQQRFTNHGYHHGHRQDQDQEQEVLTLRHILHHGGVRYPSLFRQKDLRPADVLLSEMLTGQALTHRIKTAQTTTLKPRENQQNGQQGQGQNSKKMRSQGFRSLDDTSLGPESWTRESVMAPDVTDRETILQLAKMNYNSYTEVASPGWYDLEGNWSVNSTFGWEEDGVRGHVFTSADNSTLIIAIKGTSAAILGGGGGTATRDKINDNLLFSCCCAKVDRTWRGVCDCNTGGYQCDQTCVEDSVNSDDVYYNIAIAILWAVQDMYPGANVWLTGHSLGGGLSSLLGLTFGVPTITFETPGDRLAAQRLHLPMPPAINWDDFPLYHVGHTADPIFQGVCNGKASACYYSGFAMESKCHTGRTCVYDPVTEDNWKVDIRTHRLFDSIEGVFKVKDVPACKTETDCVDCEIWEYI
ncbi:putative lipase atg15 [Podila clonocystis]|nr:putative lipase atg15 [Podila clonocystis]